MKIQSILLIIFLGISFFACKPEAPAKTKPAVKITTKAVKKKKPKKAKLSGYWPSLKKELKWDDKLIKQKKAIDIKYTSLKKALPKINGKRDTKKAASLEKQRLTEIKTLIGPEKFKKLNAFNKDWKKRKRTRKKK